MSFLDKICVFYDNLDCSSAVAANAGSHYLDLEGSHEDQTAAAYIIGEKSKQIGPVYWNVLISVAATVATDVYFKLLTDSEKTFSTTPKVLAAIGDSADPLVATDLTLGACWSIQLPTKKCQRFLGVEKVGATGTALKVDSWLGMEPLTVQNIQKYPT